jgi:GAF domain-containing protein
VEAVGAAGDLERTLDAAVSDPEWLAALARTGLLDSPPEEPFDRIARVAARRLDAPIALVSLVDRDRQFLKSCVGVDGEMASTREAPLSQSFCKHVVHSERALVVSDAREDPLLRANRAVTDLGVVAYLGIPIVDDAGAVLGSFCVVDHRPRDWSEAQRAVMEKLAAEVIAELRGDVAPPPVPGEQGGR